MTTHSGGCHCGRVRFEVVAPSVIDATDCNCSICRMTGHLHLHVSKKDFRVLQGEDALTTYTFNTGVAQHYFCSVCGVKSFYIPRSHPHGVSVNVHCLDPDTVEKVDVSAFDGKNWEQNVATLSAISD
ncbi:MAG: GFA family protein [Gammaproteobacteria bacterium]|nr:GFA family protein [Gammaproteobacteria bacterium]